jgi:hypothetical protein
MNAFEEARQLNSDHYKKYMEKLRSIFMNLRPGILIYSKNEDYLYENSENAEMTH